MFKKRSLAGLRVGKLTVLKRASRTKWRSYRWLCRCDCGNTKEVSQSQLVSKRTKSCGCIPSGPKPLSRLEAAFNQVYAAYCCGAKYRGFSWALSKKEFLALIGKNCFYCDDPPQNRRYGHMSRHLPVDPLIYGGVDRVDSKLGYFKENCVPCCAQCNTAKNKTPQKEFLAWVAKVEKHTRSLRS